jgi:hypothetical protein
MPAVHGEEACDDDKETLNSSVSSHSDNGCLGLTRTTAVFGSAYGHRGAVSAYPCSAMALTPRFRLKRLAYTAQVPNVANAGR